MSMANRVPDSSGPTWSAWLAPVLATGAFAAAALSVVHAIRAGALVAALILGAGATVIAISHAIGDRKSRREAEAGEAGAGYRLAEANERAKLLERVLDATDQGVLVVDARARVQLANAAARHILRLGARDASPAVEAIGLSLLVARVVRGGAAVSEEREVHLPTRRWIAVQALPFETGALVLVTDVTAARRLESIRKDFAANVSHELKTPVSGIALIAEQLGHAIREDPEAAARFAGQLSAETERLGNLVRDLLDLSRIESDLPLVAAEVEAMTVAGDAVERTKPLADAKRIRVSLGGGNVVFHADATQVTTAVINLIDNAVRYSPSGADVHVRVVPTPELVSFVVEDNGPGIPSSEIGRIFERFYRVDKARARATGGTGLGLAIVRHIAERHGGKVEAASDFGRGSRFTLTIPIRPED